MVPVQLTVDRWPIISSKPTLQPIHRVECPSCILNFFISQYIFMFSLRVMAASSRRTEPVFVRRRVGPEVPACLSFLLENTQLPFSSPPDRRAPVVTNVSSSWKILVGVWFFSSTWWSSRSWTWSFHLNSHGFIVGWVTCIFHPCCRKMLTHSKSC